MDVFKHPFGSTFGGFSSPTWLPKSTKIGQKSMSRCLPKLIAFFYGVLIDFGSQLRPSEPSKPWFFLRKNEVFSRNCLSKLRMIFDTILVPTWLHFASPNPPKSFQKSIPRRIDFLIDFCIDFCAILAPYWGPSWGQVGDFFGQKGGLAACSRLFLLRCRFFRLFGPPGHLLAPIWGPFW